MLAKMYKEAVPLNKKESLKLSPLQNYKHAKTITSALLAFNEVSRACKQYPVYFASDEHGVLPIAILGLKDKNVFLDSKDKWEENLYIPAVFRAYPLGMAQVDKANSERYTIVYDKAHEGINKKDGSEMTTKDGEITEFGQKAVDFLQNFQGNINKTKENLKILKEYNLLKIANIDISRGDDKYQIQSVGIIDQEALGKLNDEQILALVKSGAYRLIIMHLVSYSNVDNILTRTED